MQDYCCHFLSGRGHILFPADIGAQGQEAACRRWLAPSRSRSCRLPPALLLRSPPDAALASRSAQAIDNFWIDLTRITIRKLSRKSGRAQVELPNSNAYDSYISEGHTLHGIISPLHLTLSHSAWLGPSRLENR
jgi:hypothetical protein